MKKTVKSKMLAGLLASVCVLATACGGQTGQQAEQPGESGESYKIGVIQLVEHPALDAAYKGFADALKDNGFVQGENVEYDFQNAQGDTNNLSTISDRHVNNKSDMVLAIATPSAQAIASKTTEIPILATAVTSFEVAGLVDSDDAPGGNVTGTSDMNPVAAQIGLIAELFPETKTVGLIYSSSEDNSVLQAEMAKAEIEKLGMNYEEVTVTNANDVQQAMLSLVTKVDAIYIPTDNVLASTMPTVSGVTSEAKIPTVCGESNMVLNGGLITMGINYYDLGYKTGLMAVDIINGESSPAEMPVQYSDVSEEITINGLTAEEIGFEVPEKYASFVVEP